MQKFSLAGRWSLRKLGEDQEFPAQVPGGVHTDLMAAGRIPDPFYGDNELDVQWVAESDWQFSRAFSVSADLLAEDRVYLVCDGLDTLGKVELNGVELGRFENMFRTYRWDVKEHLKAGENRIVFTFDSPVEYAKKKESEFPLSGVQPWSIMGGPYLRKAPCHFGWDWGPMLPAIGIWKDLRLEGYSEARIMESHLRQILEDGVGTLELTVALDQWGDETLNLSMRVTGPDGKTYEQTVEGSDAWAQIAIEIENPQLWWPNGYGEQPLYDVEVTLSDGKKTIDSRSYKIGFRTIEVLREPDAWGESFTFVVNGVKVFAKGADWIPADSFPTRISDEYMEGLIRSAAQTHQNMLRVWGGGFYEEDRFYDLCDRYGILVWQDFVFACNRYPTDEAFFANVHAEAVDNVRRLRHRTSLALWCGNNEMEQGWSDWGWNKPNDHAIQRLKAGYDRMFHQMLPGIVAEEDPDHVYWPSSASSGIPFAEPNSQNRGDCHYWDVWHGRKPFTAYRETYPRFMSEFGFQSLPPMETVKAYAEEKDWNMTSYIMEHHQRSFKGNGLMIGQMTDTFRMPKDFESLVYLSMMLQAEGIRYGVEHWRRHKNRVSGILYWQLNDCWPVASWSSIDYFGRWKALHYYARKFFAPVMMSVEDDDPAMSIWVTSDVEGSWQGKVNWRLATLKGKVLDSGSEAVRLGAQESKCVFTRKFDLTPAQKRDTVFIAELAQDGETIKQVVTPFIPSKHLDLVDPELEVSVTTPARAAAVISLTAKSLARFVELRLEGTDGIFSDNYFDVPAGESVAVSVAIPEGWGITDVMQALKVNSLYDSF